MNLEKMEELLKDAQKIYNKIPKDEKTFMQISGYPHYENVCSNILAFYLDPKEQHNLGNIVLVTLLNTISKKSSLSVEDINLDNISILREYTTLKENRLDIVIKTENMVIGIENKIMAPVYNDLKDYANTLDDINKNSVKVILSLHDEHEIGNKNGFINITYNEFLNNLNEKLAEYNKKENKWYIYLVDFIKTIEGYKVEKEMETEVNKWVKENKEEINDFFKLFDIYKNNLVEKSDEYVRLMEKKITNCKIKSWTGDNFGVTRYIVLDLGCNLDVCLDVNGWRIAVFMWKKSKQSAIKSSLIEKGYNIIEEENSHVWLYKFDYDCNVEEIVNKSVEIFNLLKSIS